MALLTGFSKAGVEAILAVHGALTRHAPTWVAHFDEAVTEVTFAPHACRKGAAACVHPDRPRMVFFVVEPEYQPLAEVGRLLLHEARHWQRDVGGHWHVEGHRCSDPFCALPSEKGADPVYQYDAMARPVVAQSLRAAGYDPEASWATPTWKKVAAGAGLFTLVLGGIALLSGGGDEAAWDAQAQRYRGKDGRFTSG